MAARVACSGPVRAAPRTRIAAAPAGALPAASRLTGCPTSRLAGRATVVCEAAVGRRRSGGGGGGGPVAAMLSVLVLVMIVVVVVVVVVVIGARPSAAASAAALSRVVTARAGVTGAVMLLKGPARGGGHIGGGRADAVAGVWRQDGVRGCGPSGAMP